MTTLTFLDLIVTRGPNQGMCYTTLENMFRILGRYEKGFIADERVLNPELQELILKYIPREYRNNRGPDILLDDPSIGLAHGIILCTPNESTWIDLLKEKTQKVKKSDLIALGNSELKVS